MRKGRLGAVVLEQRADEEGKESKAAIEATIEERALTRRLLGRGRLERREKREGRGGNQSSKDEAVVKEQPASAMRLRS